MMTPDGYHELLAYRRHHPHWSLKIEFYLAQIAYFIWAAAPKDKTAKKLSLKDFIFDFDKPNKPKMKMADKMLEQRLEAWATIYGKHQ